MAPFPHPFETFVDLWATIWGTLAVLGQLCGLFWHTRGPKVEIIKKDTVLDPNKYFFGEPFGSFFIKIEGVCGCLFARLVFGVF